MKPQEKAIQLVNTYLELGMQELAKKSALIAVDETIEAMQLNSWQNRNEIEYYGEVKQEIHKL